jgi:hypothetical protein
MEHVALPVTGLEAHTEYLVCLVAGNETQTVGAPVSFVTAPVEAPEHDEVEVAGITATSAELKGVLDPKATSKGETGSYAFRYSSSGSECEVPGATQTAGEGEMTGEPKQAVSVVAGLQPDTLYTFCLVATQPGEEAKGPPVTFTTPKLAPAISGERVTSVGSNEAAVEAQIVPGAPPTKYHVEYGTSTAYGTSTTAVSLGTGGSAVRVIVRLAPLLSHTEYHFRFVAENEAGERDGADQTFTTANSVSGSTSGLPDNRVYELVSSATENITVDDNQGGIGLEVNGDAECYTAKDHAAADGDALAYQAEPPPTREGTGLLGEGKCNQWIAVRGATGWTATDVTPSDGGETEAEKSLFSSLYDAVGGPLTWSNPLPGGRPEPTSEAVVGGPASKAGAYSPDFSHAISSDGSRIYWTSVEVGSEEIYIPKKLYLEENATQPQSPIGPGGECTVSADACTIQVDAGEAKCVTEGKCTSGGGLFWTATADGSKVFFTDPNKLTAKSTAEPKEPDLYEYEVATGRLTDLTVAATGHADVGAVIGASENGEYIYFQAGGVLASNTTANGETASTERNIYGEGQNIYVLHDGVTRFISLNRGDQVEAFGSPRWDYSNEYMTDVSRGPNYRTAQVSADGRTMMFESTRRLTNYDGLPQNDGQGAVELYIYDASTGQISCASCDPAGAAQGSADGGDGGLLPVAVNSSGSGSPSYGALRSMSASGARVFFDTSNSLVPQDTNGLRDVYEWERPAVVGEANNSCSASSGSYSEVNTGCVFLLSGGQGTDASYFADADAEGNNVFFTSREKLTPLAGDENVAMYDARVGGGFLELSTACTGTGCQGVPPAPPIFATPSSVTYNGVGNFEPQPAVVAKPVVKPARCKKGTVRRAGRCVKAKGAGKRKRPGKDAKRRKK